MFCKSDEVGYHAVDLLARVVADSGIRGSSVSEYVQERSVAPPKCLMPADDRLFDIVLAIVFLRPIEVR